VGPASPMTKLLRRRRSLTRLAIAQATLAVAGHSTIAEDCIELLAMLRLTSLREGQQNVPRRPPSPYTS
jgi:hypothetical protein